MLSFSPDLEERLWGDDAILGYLEEGRKTYESGDRSALLGIARLCASLQAVIPDWATDALLDIMQKLESGDLNDLNEAFGWKASHKATRRKRHRQTEKGSDILERLQEFRLNGGTLNADEGLQSIADELGTSRRDVEEVYKRKGQFIKKLPRGNPDGHIYCFPRMKVPVPRRRGRPILRDKD
jgi:hypothetical protein